MAKILITESVHPIGPELLTAAGHTVVYADRDMDVIRREIVDADAVLVRYDADGDEHCKHDHFQNVFSFHFLYLSKYKRFRPIFKRGAQMHIAKRARM